MRTTLSLEPDVALKIKERLAEQQNASMKDIINHALRIGLQSTAPQAEVPYRVVPHALGLRAGLDPDKLNQILDDIEVSDRLARINDHS